MLNLYPHTLFWIKVLNQITVRKNKLWRFLPVGYISRQGITPSPNKIGMKEHLIKMLGCLTIISEAVSPDDKEEIIKQAESALAHEFDLLGSGSVVMNKIDWHCDFKSGHRWEKGVFYKKQRQISPAGGYDIKVPWELSRCQHFLCLGEAWLLTNDEKFAKEIVDEVSDWIDDNPLMYSVNWTCTMDVAIRAVNWIYAIGMILESDVVTDSFIDKLYKSLFQHGWFIYNNLEKTVPYSNNHLFSDYVGLLYLGFLFEGSSAGSKWKELALREYYEEIRRQILPSGVQYERSVSYHRLMTELVSYPYYMLIRMGEQVPADIVYRIRSMYSFVSAYIKPNHLAPLIEDNDDGRFLPFVKRDYRSHGYLLDSTSIDNVIIATGTKHIEYDDSRDCVIYKDAGHAVLHQGDNYLFVTNGDFSKYEDTKKTMGTHTHNDKLSFEFSVGEDDIFVDPGSYIYTSAPERCREFRSTWKHNTVIVDQEEQNIFSDNNVFQLTKNSRAEKLSLMSDNKIDGSYITYLGKLEHQRTFVLDPTSLTIIDKLSKSGTSHKAVFSFHCNENCAATISEGEKVIIETPHHVAHMYFEAGKGTISLCVEDDTVSPSYGVLKQSKTIRVRLDFDNKLEMKTRISWQRK